MPPKDLPFSDEYRDLLLDLDFEYFVNEDLNESGTSKESREVIKQHFSSTTKDIKERYRKNKKQCRLWLEGIVRLQWYGGMLPAQFRLDGFTRELNLLDYPAVGENWAYFQYWQKLERRRRFWKVSWDRITKVGAVLAIILTLLKLIETVATVD